MPDTSRNQTDTNRGDTDMKQGIFTITENTALTPTTYRMRLEGDTGAVTAPGQFIDIRLDGHFLRRPISVNDVTYPSSEGADDGVVTVIYKVLGAGTEEMTRFEPGKKLDVLTGLGNGFDVDAVPDGAYLVADGAGVAEMLELARSLLTRGKSFKAVLGYDSKHDIYMIDSYRNICNEIEVLTLDGSNGREGMPADVIRNADYVCASGTLPMLRTLAAKCKNGQFSLSNLMLSTSEPEGAVIVPTSTGATSSINDGPVYDKNEIKWDVLDAN